MLEHRTHLQVAWAHHAMVDLINGRELARVLHLVRREDLHLLVLLHQLLQEGVLVGLLALSLASPRGSR